MKHSQSIRIFINQQAFDFEDKEQTGRSIKERAAISLCHELVTKVKRKRGKDQDGRGFLNKSRIIQDDETVCLKPGEHFWSRESESEYEVKINLQAYQFIGLCITGRELKERAGIDLMDVLFRSHPEEDEVIPNDAEIHLTVDDCFYSAPPANYGSLSLSTAEVGSSEFECIPQPNGWTFLVISNFPVPAGFSQAKANLLVKLPPGFPDASPDMFWVTPHLKTSAGSAPQGTCFESLLNEQWQRFSWHLRPGSWRPGVSTLRDFMRCVIARFEKKN